MIERMLANKLRHALGFDSPFMIQPEIGGCPGQCAHLAQVMPARPVDAANARCQFILHDLDQLLVTLQHVFAPALKHVGVVGLDVERFDHGTPKNRRAQGAQGWQLQKHGHGHIKHHKRRAFLAFDDLVRDHAPEQ